MLVVRRRNSSRVRWSSKKTPRIADVKVGDTVSFFGEYVWNEQGGLIHWTHHDPAGPNA